MTDTNKLQAIREHLQNLSGLREEPFGNRIRKTVGFEVLDQADMTNSISALLEVCYYALDGHGSFVESKHPHKTPIASVTKVIEMVIDLLPHDQMYGLDNITEILADGASKKA